MLIRKAVYLNRVRKSQFFSRRKLINFQKEATDELLIHAKKNVPFYKKKYSKINSLSLKDYPIISRPEFLDAGIDTFSKIHKYIKKESLRERATSGSTGNAFTVKYDERAYDYLESIYARAFFAQGYNPFKKMGYYWYEPLKIKPHNLLGLFRRHYISCYWSMSKQILELKKFNFEYVHYFSSVLYYISRIIKPSDARKIRPKLILCHAELLSDKMRERIEKTFNAKVLDMYGTTEFVRMAWQCPICKGYHVEEDSMVLEILDENNNPCPPGKQGRFVVTGLANYLLPLIRYEMGDYGQWSKNKVKCGRGLRLIDGVEGREDDFLISKSKEKIPPKKIIDALDPIEELAFFKVIQIKKDEFDILVQVQKEIPKEKIKLALNPLLGEVKFNFKKSPPLFSKRGKLRLVENKSIWGGV